MKNNKIKYLDILRLTSPETVENLLTIIGAGYCIVYGIDTITTVNDAELLINISIEFSDFNNKPEKYLIYSSLEEAWKAYDIAASWLTEHNISERISLFQFFTTQVMEMSYYIEEDFPKSEIHDTMYYNFQSLIHDLGTPMKLNTQEICKIITKSKKIVKSRMEGD